MISLPYSRFKGIGFFMTNFNGTLVEEANILSPNNRGYAYGDALFETIKVAAGNILFWEDHYFRLMASMRIMRMEIPMDFTMEFLEEEILKTLMANNMASARVKLFVHRNEGGFYSPDTTTISFIINVRQHDQLFYTINENKYEVDLFKDHYIAPGLLSTLKTNNKALHVVGSVYAKENGLQNCLLLNTDKQVTEALNGNVFLVKGNTVKTPPIANGCLKGILRKQVIDIVNKSPDYHLEESSISPFELQQADELFLTNVMVGIQPITKYRKKLFATNVATALLNALNGTIRIN